MNEIFLKRSSRAIVSATLEETGNTWNMPFGSSVSANSSASSRAPSGVARAGLTTMGAPTARDGATLCATRFSGKLNGVIPSTGPKAKRRISPIREPSDASVSRRISSSSPWRMTSDAQRNVETARVASTFAHLSGLPPSWAIISAFRSIRSASRREMWSSASARAWTGRCCDSSNVLAAVAIASSTSSSVGTPTSATTLPSHVLFTSKDSRPVRHSPFTR